MPDLSVAEMQLRIARAGALGDIGQTASVLDAVKELEEVRRVEWQT